MKRKTLFFSFFLILLPVLSLSAREAGFRSLSRTFDPSVDRPSVQRYIKYFLRGEHKKKLARALLSGAPYIGYIKDQAKKSNVPPEILYLAAVESAFKFTARSRAGAVGLWQFIPSAAREYNLQMTSWVDERRSFWKATPAAMQKLLYNYRRTGNWYLSMAAYNSGLGRALKAKRYGGSSDFFYLRSLRLFPRETREYVPQIIAVAYIVSNMDRYHLFTKAQEKQYLSDVSSSHWGTVRVDRPIPLSYISSQAGIDPVLLSHANFELLYGVTPPNGGGYELKVPASKVSIVRAVVSSFPHYYVLYPYYIPTSMNFAKFAKINKFNASVLLSVNPGMTLRTSLKRRTVLIPYLSYASWSRGKRSLWNAMLPYQNFVYYVRRGDNLSTIAYRYGTTIDRISAVNGLSYRSLLRIGQRLYIPGSKAAARYAAARLRKQAAHTIYWNYYVRRGDTLSAIARRYGARQSSLVAMNASLRKSGIIYVGQKLRIPGKRYSAPAPNRSSFGVFGGKYTVRAGDTLSSIAYAHGTTVALLTSRNKLSPYQLLHIGQTLIVPPTTDSQRRFYRVKSGDTLSQIALNHNVSVSTLMSLNDLSSTSALQVGQVLQIASSTSQNRSSGKSSSSGQSWSYVVRSGDSLSTIASHYGVSVSYLARYNALSGAVIRVGQTLQVPKNPASKASLRIYTVRRGDTLSGIALAHSASVQKIARLNGLSSGSRLRIGQKLYVPMQVAAHTAHTYLVRSGDSLWTIATHFKTTVSALAKLNNISPWSPLYVGYRLRLP